MTTAKPFILVPVAKLLPEHIIKSLSHDARRLFQCVWNRASYQGKNTLATTNGIVAKCSHLKLKRLLAAQQELVAAGLVAIEFETREGFAVRAQRVVYTFDI